MLDAQFSEDRTQTTHRFVVRGWRGQETTFRSVWKRTKHLGAGGFGSVFREECIDGELVGAVRAVKSIVINVQAQGKGKKALNYGRELEAMAKFSQDKVRFAD
jgi:hypothetical protein